MYIFKTKVDAAFKAQGQLCAGKWAKAVIHNRRCSYSIFTCLSLIIVASEISHHLLL